LELALEKVMLMVVGLCVASMICIPLIQNGVEQISDQYAGSQFRNMTTAIDSEIRSLIDNATHSTYQGDIFVPQGVTINSSIKNNEVSYYFSSNSTKIAIHKVYGLAVAVNFDYDAGWYRIKISLDKTMLVVVSFSFIGTA
jgi:hypothetical protein